MLTKALTKDTVLRSLTPWRTKCYFYDNLKEREQKRKLSYRTRTLAFKQPSYISIFDVTLTYVVRGDSIQF